MKRISIEIRFFECSGFGSILSKNREILDTVKALNAVFYGSLSTVVGWRKAKIEKGQI